MKVKILKTFQLNYIKYLKNTEFALYAYGPFYQFTHKLYGQDIILHKKFIDDRIKQGIIQII